MTMLKNNALNLKTWRCQNQLGYSEVPKARLKTIFTERVYSTRKKKRVSIKETGIINF